MSRAKLLILRMGGKQYPIFEVQTTTDPDSGADISKYSEYTKVLAWIQPTGASGSTKGIILNDSEAGDSVTADIFMYHETILKPHDRIQYKGKWYEIRAIEDWETSFLHFYKSYLVKVDSQNEDTDSTDSDL